MSVRMMIPESEAFEKPGVLKPDVATITYDGKTLYMKESYKGLVLSTGEHNYYDDSDFYALVWDAEKVCPVEIGYATTRAWTYPNSATVDKTPEIWAAYMAYLDAELAKKAKAVAELEAKRVAVGKVVKVVKGRKVALGTVGKVFWMKEMDFTPRYRNGWKTQPDTVKIGIALSDDRDGRGRYSDVAWTYAANVEVLG